MNKPRICAVIVSNEPQFLKEAEEADLFEVRIDLIGEGWRGLVKALDKPWIACNRSAGEKGGWNRSEPERIQELTRALELGAGIIDLELSTEDLGKVVRQFKGKAKCLISFHDWQETPPLEKMRDIVRLQLESGADICKVVTTANRLEDNLSILELVQEFSKKKIISFAMGASGYISRILSPLSGGYLTYASVAQGRESAPGQITVKDLKRIYSLLGRKYDNR